MVTFRGGVSGGTSGCRSVNVLQRLRQKVYFQKGQTCRNMTCADYSWDSVVLLICCVSPVKDMRRCSDSYWFVWWSSQVHFSEGHRFSVHEFTHINLTFPTVYDYILVCIKKVTNICLKKNISQTLSEIKSLGNKR